MNSFVIAVIRTGVPYAVGFVISWLATVGFTVSDDLRVQLINLGTFLVGTLYYVAVKWLERKWPQLGVLLGVPIQPVYGDPSQSDETTEPDPDPNLDSGVPPAETGDDTTGVGD